MTSLGNQNAAHAVKPDRYLHMRVSGEQIARWRESAQLAGLTLSQWVREQLDAHTGQCAQFNATYPVGSEFLFGERTVRTRSEAREAPGGTIVVSIHGRKSGVNIMELIA